MMYLMYPAESRPSFILVIIHPPSRKPKKQSKDDVKRWDDKQKIRPVKPKKLSNS